MRRAFAYALIGCLLSACGPKASQGDFDSDNPAAKLYAIRQAGEAKDRSKIPRLVEQLDSDDESVRMMSIAALDRITGERLGYNAFDPPEERQPAVRRWETAVREHKFDK